MVYTIGPISGCHVNPAVTFGALLSGRIRVKQAVGYMLAQIMGAIVAAAIVLFIASGGPNGYNAGAGGLAANGYGVHSPGHYSLFAAFAAICDHCAWRHRREIAGRVCRLGDRIDAYVSAPCRHSGHKHVSESSPQHRASPLGRGLALHQIWLFIVTPLIGGAIAAAIYRGVKSSVSSRRSRRKKHSGASRLKGESSHDLRLRLTWSGSHVTRKRQAAMVGLGSRYNSNIRLKQ
jgi:aquaporin Z